MEFLSRHFDRKSASMSGTSNTADGLNAAAKNVVADLASKLSSNAKIVTEQDEEFKALHERWSNIGKKTPAAIVSVATEADVQETVRPAILTDPQLGNSNVVAG